MSRCAERGDYRLRRRGLGWVLERRWSGGWTRVGLPMRYVTAHAVMHELHDWQEQASEEVRRVMRGELPDMTRWRP